MLAKQLKLMYDPFISLPIEVWEGFSSLGEVKDLPKETVIKAANSTERYMNMLLRGSGGNLLWNKNNFVCIDIAFENEFLCDYYSFASQKPTPIEVRLFEDSKLFRISYDQFQLTFKKGSHGERVTRIMAEASLFDKQQQQIDLLTKTAKERYLEQVQNRQGFARTPLKYLASYLGITPQSLSRIRSEKV